MTQPRRAYFKDCTKEIPLVDMHGAPLQEGDLLSWDYGDPNFSGEVKPWMRQAVFIIVRHPTIDGFSGRGLREHLYLHDFRFKYCAKVATASLETAS